MKGQMELKRKYGLVHVPNHHRLEAWLHRYRALLGEGEPPEIAGWRAAKELFPYEAKERRAPDLPTAEAVSEALGQEFTA